MGNCTLRKSPDKSCVATLFLFLGSGAQHVAALKDGNPPRRGSFFGTPTSAPHARSLFSSSVFVVACLEPHELRGSLYYMGKLRKVFELSFVFERHVKIGERSEKPSGFLELVLGWQWKGSSAILGGGSLGDDFL